MTLFGIYVDHTRLRCLRFADQMVREDEADLEAFVQADRACRESQLGSAEAHITRGLAYLRLGDSAAAGTDFDRALRLGSADPSVVSVVLARHPDIACQDLAARLTIGNDRASDAEVDAACILILARGRDLVLHGRRIGENLCGWVVGLSTALPTLRLMLDDGSGDGVPLVLDSCSIRDRRIKRWCFAAVIRASRPIRLVAAPRKGAPESLILHAPPLATRWRSRASSPPSDLTGSKINVVIPIYGDPQSLSACLSALKRQTPARLSFVVIDDASTDPEISRLGREFCQAVGGLYRRNRLNAGFAASVNLGVSLCRTGDVLLLNSDVILPDGALDRLSCAAQRSTDIGIVAPLSNDAGNVTFPDPMRPAPPLSWPTAMTADDTARRVNRGRIVDVPSALGSCLFITRACLETIGPLSLAYGRGYFEDVDLCLRARERGFRTVAACDTYVSHGSGRSFRGERYALIARNALVLEARFPDHAGMDAAHDRADPLRSARAAIEEALPLTGVPVVLVLGRKTTAEAVMDWRQEVLRREGQAVLTWSWQSVGNEIVFNVVPSTGDGPRSLAFVLDEPGRKRLGRYLEALSIVRIEVCEPHTLPDAVWDWLEAADIRVVLVVDGREEAKAVSNRGLNAGDGGIARFGHATLLPTDALTAAWLDEWPSTRARRTRIADASAQSEAAEDGVQSKPPAGPDRSAWRIRREEETNSRPSIRRLGIVMPMIDLRAEQLIADLGRVCVCQGGPRLILLGRCVAENTVTSSGAVWVTGSLSMADLPGAVRSHWIDALFLPYRAEYHWVLDAAAEERSLRRAYFDWTPRGCRAAPGDLALDPNATGIEVGARLLAWCGSPLAGNGA